MRSPSSAHIRTSGKCLHEIWTDASTSVSCGAACLASGRWFQLLWPEPCQGKWVQLNETGIVVQELRTSNCISLCNLGTYVASFISYGPL